MAVQNGARSSIRSPAVGAAVRQRPSSCSVSFFSWARAVSTGVSSLHRAWASADLRAGSAAVLGCCNCRAAQRPVLLRLAQDWFALQLHRPRRLGALLRGVRPGRAGALRSAALVAPRPPATPGRLVPTCLALQVRVLNKCGMTEERPCMGPGVVGCDGVCAHPSSHMKVKEVDCMGVRYPPPRPSDGGCWVHSRRAAAAPPHGTLIAPVGCASWGV